MQKAIKYRCSKCGKDHDEWPALAYSSPSNYESLSAEDKINTAELDSDFCVITHPDQTDRFIRCTLTLKVSDHCVNLDYGLWVSLSETSFQDYHENFDNKSHEAKYFGWLCSNLPDYVFSESIPTTVYTRTGNQRPEIVPHKDFDHPFVRDYYNGITKLEAERRINDMLSGAENITNRELNIKPWWKIWKHTNFTDLLLLDKLF